MDNPMVLPMSGRVLPTPQQLEWADCEIGVIIHLDLQVFEPSYSFRKEPGYTPAPSVFNPSNLDTDQWLDTAKSAGAKYAVLVTKHFSGFSLWPTKAHGFSVSSSPWRKGRGNVVGDFFRSCERYGIKPGLYYNAAYNAYSRVYGKGRVLSGRDEEQRAYNYLVEKQLAELWSEYGDVFEIWFDGGLVPPHLGGPEIIPLLEKLQPRAVVFQGPPGWPGLIRWVGNERGEAPYPCWSRTDMLSSDDGMTERVTWRDLHSGQCGLLLNPTCPTAIRIKLSWEGGSGGKAKTACCILSVILLNGIIDPWDAIPISCSAWL